jgi:serine O-acetyltransferase
MVFEQCLPITSTELLEKVFPVYALGLPDPNPDYILDGSDPIWVAIKAEAKLEAEKEPILSSFLYASVLAHECLEQVLAFVVANRLQSPTLLATQLVPRSCICWRWSLSLAGASWAETGNRPCWSP